MLSCKFEYGPNESYGTTVPCNDPGFGSDPVTVSAEATPLLPDSTYHYRVTATNEGGTTVGPDQTLKTLIDKATAKTGGVSAQQTTATLEGTVNPGGNPLTECVFEYGSDASYGTTGALRQPAGRRDGRRSRQLPRSPVCSRTPNTTTGSSRSMPVACSPPRTGQ